MPNHVKNRVVVTGDVAAVYDLLFRDGKVDFNVLAPMPPALMEVESGSYLWTGMEALGIQNFDVPFPNMEATKHLKETARKNLTDYDEDRREQCIAITLKGIECILRYGHASWYEWSQANWGTKWNAYDQVEVERPTQSPFQFEFSTAWSTPMPIWDALQEKLPEGTSIHLTWMDEGGPSGIIIFDRAGEEFQETQESYWGDREDDEDDEANN